jgi:hypothetical protein
VANTDFLSGSMPKSSVSEKLFFFRAERTTNMYKDMYCSTTFFDIYSIRSTYEIAGHYTLIKNKIKLSSCKRKFRRDQLQSHI